MKSAYKTPADVASALKSALKRAHKAARTARNAGYLVSPTYKTYRSVFGPYKVRRGVFESGRYYFDPMTLEATSYDWWHMLRVINGKLVRNVCGYSMQTSGHQQMLDKALDALGIVPDLTVNTRAPIRDLTRWKARVLADWAEAMITAKYGRKSSDWRGQWVKRKAREMVRLEKAKIGLRFTGKDKLRALEAAELSRQKRLSFARERRTRTKGFPVQERKTVNAPVVAALPRSSHLTLVQGENHE